MQFNLIFDLPITKMRSINEVGIAYNRFAKDACGEKRGVAAK